MESFYQNLKRLASDEDLPEWVIQMCKKNSSVWREERSYLAQKEEVIRKLNELIRAGDTKHDKLRNRLLDETGSTESLSFIRAKEIVRDL